MPFGKFSARNITIDGTASTAPIEFFLGIQRTIYAGLEPFAKFGFNSSVSNNAYEQVWAGSTPYTYPTTAAVLSISSNDADDTAAGTGARTILVQGLDSNYDLQEETVTLNGTSTVNTVNSYIRVNRMAVTSSGTQRVNDGDITATHSGTSIAIIPAEFGVTQQLIYTVPNGYSLYLYEFAALVSNGKETNTQLRIRDFTQNTFQVREFLTHTESITIFITPLVRVSEKSDIELRSQASTGSHQVSGFFHGVLVNESEATI